MIDTIEICGAATFGTTPCVVNQLSTFNYFYGANASGKTTISRVIADEARFSTCKVTWRGGSPLEPLVYNRDFVEQHFRASDDLPGIFTLGANNTEVAVKIATAKKHCEQLLGDIGALKRTLRGENGNGGKLAELAKVEDDFEHVCWKQKQEHDGTLRMAFEGYRNSAKKFKEKILEERSSNKAEQHTLAYLLERAATVFADDIARISPVPLLDSTKLLACEKSPILLKKVIGKSDVDIAAMIQRLGNSDWVRAGRTFLDVNDRTCPFCQQDVSDTFIASLVEYFDESFEADNRAISELATEYDLHTRAAKDAIGAILLDPSSLLDYSELAAKEQLLDAQCEINRQRLRKKQKEPSRSVQLQSSESLMTEIHRIIAEANKKIREHNLTVDNLAKERQTLKAQVWRFLLDAPLKGPIATYEAKRVALNKAISSLKNQIQEKEAAKRAKESEIRDLEHSVTSIQPTINTINGLLKLFGFHGFSLAQADGGRSYKLVRPDGTDAKESLSEGERTFITFLYFYHLLNGSVSESGMTRDRIVVFDDPVSSLDSDILFIVSTLIRKLCTDIRARTNSVKQLFLLTHNVYFHKEVTFNNRRGDGKLIEETFWTVRKVSGESQVTRHVSNPIKSSYELLWLEVRERKDGNLSIQNAMRRILETYFKILGGINLDTLHERFEGDEKLACHALLSWVNDRSHSAHDDLYVALDDATVDLYREVFRKIFEVQNHLEHYKMMMAAPPAFVPPS